MSREPESRAPRKSFHRAALKAAMVTGFFSAVVASLLLVNYFQLRTSDPLDLPATAKLRKEIAVDPGNEQLRDTLRLLDLQARRAFFTSQYQVRTGAFLLLAGVAATIGFLSLAGKMADQPTTPTGTQRFEDPFLLNAPARSALLGTGVALAAAAAFMILLTGTPPELSTKGPPQSREPGTKASMLPHPDAAGYWPYFRGPLGHAVAQSTNIPVSWDAGTGANVAWKTGIDLPGNNSPAVWDNRVFVSGSDGTNAALYCMDTNNGALLWKCNLPVRGIFPQIMEETGYAASSVATDGQRVFAIFANGQVSAVDYSGKHLWSRGLGAPKNQYGHSSSLIVYDRLLIVQFDSDSQGRLLALDAETGDPAWDICRATSASWSTPVLADVDGVHQLLVVGTPIVAAHNPSNGRVIWSLECLSGEVVPAATYANGFIYPCMENSFMSAIKLGTAPEILWQYEDDLPNVSTPVATSNRVLITSGIGVITCLNAGNGKVVWTHEHEEGFYASPILVGNLVYVMDMNGVTLVFPIDSGKFEQLAANPTGTPCSCTPAFVNDSIYIRTHNSVICVRETKN